MKRPTASPVGEIGGLGAQLAAALDELVPQGRVGIAVSGGGDSMALLAIAVDWARARGRELLAATVDHGLRSESANEAAFVGETCARLGVPHRTLTVSEFPGGNLQAAAREARYSSLADWARSADVGAVLLGHTLDDQAETLLMRLARGSGVEGLSGMAARRDEDGIAWVRPMLGVRRAALREWLQARGIRWIDDPTNEDPGFDRVKARRALAALAPLGITVEGLGETAHILARQRRVLARAAAETALVALHPGQFGEVRLALAPLRATERDTALRIFADTLVRVGGRTYRPRFRAVEPALERLLAGAGGAVTLAGCLVVPDEAGDAALICREPAAVAGPRPLTPPGTVWDGRWRVTIVDRAVAALHLAALGAAGLEHLSRKAKEGSWQPPAAWSAAPRHVRETVPAVYGSANAGPQALLIVPQAGYVAPEAASWLPSVTARLLD